MIFNKHKISTRIHKKYLQIFVITTVAKIYTE